MLAYPGSSCSIFLEIAVYIRNTQTMWEEKVGIIMKENRIQIIVTYVYHLIFILLGFLLMRNSYNTLLVISIIAGILYLIYWIVLNRKGHMAWIVYLNFVIGTVIELLLNGFGIIPEDGGFFPGLAQLFYMFLLLIHVAALGIANLILWLIDKRRHKIRRST